MYNPHMIIMILSVIILVLSILIFSKKDKSSEYFQTCIYPGEGNIPSTNCGSPACSVACKKWCAASYCMKE